MSAKDVKISRSNGQKETGFLLCNCNVMGASRPRIGVSTQNPGLKLIVVVVDGEGTTERDEKRDSDAFEGEGEREI